MESAIPSHLRCPRTQGSRMPDAFEPAFPGWSARPDPAVERIAIAYFGIQTRGEALRGTARAALRDMLELLKAADGPRHHDIAHHVDAEGHDNFVVIAYWLDSAAFGRWRAASGYDAWWNDEARLGEGPGYFREVLTPSSSSFETLTSDPGALAGVSAAVGMTTALPIREHGYWGGMRDRLPRARTDALEPSGEPSPAAIAGDGRRIRIAGIDNLAVIRSGQDWSLAEGEEREMYVRQVEPALNAGMAFLRDGGSREGCFANAYMRLLDPAGRAKEQTFGYSLWRSLAALEAWSEHHPTHMAILGSFMELVARMKGALAVRLYHEVCVLRADEQDFEYINCHSRTGMMNACRAHGGNWTGVTKPEAGA